MADAPPAYEHAGPAYTEPPPLPPYLEKRNDGNGFPALSNPAQSYVAYRPPTGIPDVLRAHAPPAPPYTPMSPYYNEKASAVHFAAHDVEHEYARPPSSHYSQDDGFDRRYYSSRDDDDRWNHRYRRREDDSDYSDGYDDDDDRDRGRYSGSDRAQRWRPDRRADQRGERFSPGGKLGGRDMLGASDQSRGHGAAVFGGASGAFLGHELTDSLVGTLGGLVFGAVVANAVEKMHERRGAKTASRRGYSGGYQYDDRHR